MKRRMLTKRQNKANFAKTAGYVNPRNIGVSMMRGGARK